MTWIKSPPRDRVCSIAAIPSSDLADSAKIRRSLSRRGEGQRHAGEGEQLSASLYENVISSLCFEKSIARTVPR